MTFWYSFFCPFTVIGLSTIGISGVIAFHCIEVLLYSGNNRRPLQHNKRDAKSILQTQTGKTKKNYYVSRWSLRRTVSAGAYFLFFDMKISIFSVLQINGLGNSNSKD